jgi:hypothetical protein
VWLITFNCERKKLSNYAESSLTIYDKNPFQSKVINECRGTSWEDVEPRQWKSTTLFLFSKFLSLPIKQWMPLGGRKKFSHRINLLLCPFNQFRQLLFDERLSFFCCFKCLSTQLLIKLYPSLHLPSLWWRFRSIKSFIPFWCFSSKTHSTQYDIDIL